MNQQKLSLYLKVILAVVAVCGLIIYFLILPNCGESLHASFPEFASWHWPWLIFLWITAIPCFAAIYFAWQIAVNIGKDKSFSLENARLLQVIAWLAAGVTLYYFIGNVVFFFLNMNHPGIMLIALLICSAGVAVTVAAVCLSHLVSKAADLQEQSDLTV